MLVALLAALGAAAAVVPQFGLADPPAGLSVVVVAVGQGDGIVLRAPDGTVHVVDAGPSGQGTAAMLPAIAALQPTGYGYTVLSHFHDDHHGGLDEVLAALPFQLALDRGDLNRPSNAGVNAYLAAAGARRQTIVLGGVYALGGGAVLRCIAVDGGIVGGAFVDPTQSQQEENSRSIALRLDYGQFSMWLGGDLTGGGNGTADVESPASLACGDVDVYKLNHHGSNTSTNLNLVTRLSPELAVISCGAPNGYGHPTAAVVNRLNQAAAMRALLSTTTGSANTIGFGVTGTLRLDSDGVRYRVTAQNGDFLDFWCDEIVVPPPAAGELRLAELHRDPALVPDTNGEYVEVQNVGGRPLGLRGLRLADNGATVTLATNLMLLPGRAMLFQADGAPGRNGGQPLGLVWPFGTVALGDGADTVTLGHGALTLDSLAYGSGFPGGSGVAAERVDLLAGAAAANWAPAPNPYGGPGGDRGSPGRGNDADATAHPVRCAVDVRATAIEVHATALDLPLHFSWLLLSQGTTPGTPFGSVTIPLALDPLMVDSLYLPGFLWFVPPGGYRSVTVPIPQPNPLPGATLYACHVVLDGSLGVPGLSTAAPFTLP